MFILILTLLLQFGEEDISITNYSYKVYNASKQNWAILEAEDGTVYVGNNTGLLEFDGAHWNSHSIPNYTVRSLLEHDKFLYIGGVNQFGYLGYGAYGEKKYISLSDSLENSENIGYIHYVYGINQSIYFISSSYIFIYKKNVLHRIPIVNRAYRSFNFRNTIYVQDKKRGLTALKDGYLKELQFGSFFKDKYVMFMEEYKNQLLIGTFQNGMFLVQDGRISEMPLPNALKKKKINTGSYVEGKLILGTRKHGVYILENGTLNSHTNVQNGLLDNNVKSLFYGKNNHLWLALNNGISKLNLSTPFQKFREVFDQEINVFDLIRFNHRLYLATGKGLFWFDEQRNRYVPTSIRSKTRHLAIFQNQLIVPTETGVFKLDEQFNIQFLSDDILDVVYPSHDDPNLLYAYSRKYNSLQLLTLTKNTLKATAITTLTAKIRSIVEENEQTLWLGSSHSGAFKVDLSTGSYAHIARFEGEKQSQVEVSRIDGTIYFSTMKTLYELNQGTIRTSRLIKQLPKHFDAGIQRLIPDGKGFWFRSDKRYYFYSDKAGKNKHRILNTIPTSSNNKIYPDPEKKGIVWFAEEGQLIRYDSNLSLDVNAPFSVYIRRIYLRTDSLLFGGQHPKEKRHSFALNYTTDALRFTFSAPFYTRPSQTLYSYKLGGFNEEWSSWSKETFKDYTGLYEGTYTFMVRAKNVYETESIIDTYTFTIFPPWYRTWYAFLSYSILFLFSVGFIYRYFSLKKAQRFKERYRLEQAEAKARELELKNRLDKQEMRTRIASDLHDDVGSNLNGIGLLSGLLIQSGSLDEKSRLRVEEIRENALYSASAMRDIVWFINPHNDSFEKTLEKIRHELSKHLEHLELSVRIEKEVTYLTIDIDIRRHVYMIFKEALQNIIKHSQAKKVLFEVYLNEEMLWMRLKDDGIGFNMDQPNYGNGLQNFKERAEAIGAKFMLHTSEGNGCELMLSFQVKRVKEH